MDEFVRRSYMCEVRSEDGNSENERIIVGRPIVYELPYQPHDRYDPDGEKSKRQYKQYDAVDC